MTTHNFKVVYQPKPESGYYYQLEPDSDFIGPLPYFDKIFSTLAKIRYYRKDAKVYYSPSKGLKLFGVVQALPKSKDKRRGRPVAAKCQ